MERVFFPDQLYHHFTFNERSSLNQRLTGQNKVFLWVLFRMVPLLIVLALNISPLVSAKGERVI